MPHPDNSKTEGIAPSAFEPLSAQDGPSKPEKRPWRWIPITTAIIFIVVMAFLLSARSLEIKVLAEGEADISISGGLAMPFGSRYLLRQGLYEVTVQVSGYRPMVSEVNVDDQDRQILELTPLPLPGEISFNSQPAEAEVLLDGEPLGHTPLPAQLLEAGNYQVEFHAPRYLPLSQPLVVTGRTIAQQVDIALAPAWAEASIDSEPTGASIFLGEELLGITPAVVEILQGEQQITLRKDGYADWSVELEITAGQAVDLGLAELTPASGLLYLASTPSGANVTVDGEFRGQTPVTLELSPNRSHNIAVFKPGYRRTTSVISMAAGDTTERDISLKAQLGEVYFNISPPTAVLRVNGKPLGKGSQTLSLPAFEQSVEVALAGHATYRQRITPRPGLKQVVNVSLKTEQESRLARIKPEVTSALGQTLLLFNPAAAKSDFTMGASRRESGRRANEVLHPVSLKRMFYLQTTEVTNAQFRLFSASHNSGQIEGNSLNREHQPAVTISWQQAAQFCNWLSKKEGLPLFYRETNGIINGFNPASTGYRLPSEAEWAWAARVDGEAVKKFPWGDAFPPTATLENYADNSSAYVTGRILGGYKDGHVVSAPVASFAPNHNRLYDMGGNVAEWVHDVYGIPAANGTTMTDPLGAQSGDNFVVKGASWTQSKISELRLSHRDYGQAGRDDVGFRLARYAE
jgi:formylglycine-generating enzyme required for sulfatase activity